MVQRGLFRKTPSGAIFRITRPGVDIADAGETDYLLHEDHLYTQPYFFTFVTCPFAGYDGNDLRNSTVSVTIPNVDPNPIVICYPLSSGSVTCFPSPRSKGVGDTLNGFAVDDWSVNFQIVSPTRIDVQFFKYAGAHLSPAGCYLMLMRRP